MSLHLLLRTLTALVSRLHSDARGLQRHCTALCDLAPELSSWLLPHCLSGIDTSSVALAGSADVGKSDAKLIFLISDLFLPGLSKAYIEHITENVSLFDILGQFFQEPNVVSSYLFQESFKNFFCIIVFTFLLIR